MAALAAKARQGVRVRLIYDFGGSLVSARLFDPLVAAGGEVRCFNPPHLDSPLGWLDARSPQDDLSGQRGRFRHGALRCTPVDGNAARGIPPWRDTGVEVRGPAVAEIEHAFAQVWNSIGPELPEAELTAPRTPWIRPVT